MTVVGKVKLKISSRIGLPLPWGDTFKCLLLPIIVLVLYITRHYFELPELPEVPVLTASGQGAFVFVFALILYLLARIIVLNLNFSPIA
ncbi:MAG: hypothetical protein ISR65_18435 [Bacteriovoracaceae bacterium]|nr:hypothetical protein [Bacteriovoracaceae bacterium]